jgi:ferredoxin
MIYYELEVETMRVRVDEDVCGGFGLCNQHLPEVFGLNDIGFSVVQGDGTVPAPYEELARLAIASCPTGAISEVIAGPEGPQEA